MTDRGNIKLPAAEFEKHNERRQEMGLSWTEYIDGQAPDATIDDDVKAQLDRIESAASTAEDRTGQIQGTLEDMGARR